MKSSHVLLVAIAAFLVGQVFNRDVTSASAQQAPQNAPQNAPQIGRFQMKTFDYGADNRSAYGCYILDTATGELWSKYEARPLQEAGGPRLK